MASQAVILYDVIIQMVMNGFGPGPRIPKPAVRCRVCMTAADSPEKVSHLVSEEHCVKKVEALLMSTQIGWTNLCECGERHPVYGNVEIRTGHK
jgi:hypothetical protein